MIGLDRPRQLLREGARLGRRERAVELRVEVHPLAAARHRHRLEPDVAQDPAGDAGDLDALGQTGPRPRVEIDDEPVGVRR